MAKNIGIAAKKTVKPDKVVEKVLPEKPKVKPFDSRPNLSKLYLYVTIVDAGVGKSIIKLLESVGSSCQFVNVGTGTASEQVMKVLNITNNQKEIVFSFVRETHLPDVEKEINAFFLVNKKNRGIGFAIPLTTVMGVRVYKFLTQTI